MPESLSPEPSPQDSSASGPIELLPLENDEVSYQFLRRGLNVFLGSVQQRVTPSRPKPIKYKFQEKDLFSFSVWNQGGPDGHVAPSLTQVTGLNASIQRFPSRSRLEVIFQLTTWKVTIGVDLHDGSSVGIWSIGIDSVIIVPNDAVHSVLYPSLHVLPSPNQLQDYLTLPYQSGAFVANPNRARFGSATGTLELPYTGNGSSPIGTANMQWMSFGNRATNECLYFAATDGQGYAKDVSLAAEGTATRIAFQNYPKDNGRPTTEDPVRQGNLPYSLPYAVEIGPIDGKVFEASQRYRSWARKQAWVGQPLSLKLNDTVREAAAFGTYDAVNRLIPSVWESLANGLRSWRNFLRIEKTCGLWYGLNALNDPAAAGPPPDVVDPDNYFPFVEFNVAAQKAVQQLIAEGNAIARYWRLGVIYEDDPEHFKAMAPFAVENYGANDKGPLEIVLKLEGGGFGRVAFLNPILDEAQAYNVDETAIHFESAPDVGLYNDVFPIQFFDYSDRPGHSQGGGNDSTKGWRIQLHSLRSRLTSSSFFMGYEYPQEALLSASDFALQNINGANLGLYDRRFFDVWVLPEGGFPGVYNDYVILAPSAAVAAVTNPNQATKQLGAYLWGSFLHMGYMPGINGDEKTPFPPGASIGAQDLFLFLRHLVRTYDRFQDFLKLGRRHRDLQMSEVSGMTTIPVPEGLTARIFTEWYPAIPQVFGSRWIAENGDALLVLINIVDSPASLSLSINLSDLGFGNDAVRVAYTVNGGAEAYAGEFIGNFTYSANLGAWSTLGFRFREAASS